MSILKDKVLETSELRFQRKTKTINAKFPEIKQIFKDSKNLRRKKSPEKSNCFKRTSKNNIMKVKYHIFKMKFESKD